MPLLKVDHLTKRYNTGFWPFTAPQIYTAVDGISFYLDKGEILGFLGSNGAGKTTTIQMLLGTLTPTSGTIFYFDRDFQHNRISLLKRIGYASGYDRLPAKLTICENLHMVGRIYSLSKSKRDYQIEKLLKVFGMWEMKDRQVGTLSAGQVTRVMLAKAFMADPEIVLLDEPTASLDPDIANEVHTFILAQRTERTISLLITSHNMEEVTKLCDRVLVLKKGVLIADSTPEQLARSTSKVHVHLTFMKDLEHVRSFISSQGCSYTLQGKELTIEIDEYHIAQLLADLGKHQLIYSQIAINKPTLEDYFLSIAKH